MPIDLYIPGCPPTPLATIHGFAVALGLLQQKMAAVHHIQQAGEHSALLHPEYPLDLRIEIERESRRMAGYWHGKRIAETFIGLTASPLREGNLQGAANALSEYLQTRNDPGLSEIMNCLEGIFDSRKRSCVNMTAKVTVYQLSHKFINKREDVPDHAQQVVYYALGQSGRAQRRNGRK